MEKNMILEISKFKMPKNINEIPLYGIIMMQQNEGGNL